MTVKRASKKKPSPKTKRAVKDLAPKKGVKAGTPRSNQGWGKWEVNPQLVLDPEG